MSVVATTLLARSAHGASAPSAWGPMMKNFVAGVAATVAGLVLVGWVMESVPTFGSAQAAATRAVDASAAFAGSAATGALILAGVLTSGALAYLAYKVWSARRGIMSTADFGVPLLTVAIAGVLLYRGLHAWSETALHGPVLVAVAAMAGVWAVRMGRSRVESLLRIA